MHIIMFMKQKTFIFIKSPRLCLFCVRKVVVFCIHLHNKRKRYREKMIKEKERTENESERENVKMIDR
jgi:hypothetical protein